MPVFPIKLILMLVIPVGLAAIILSVAGRRGASVFKKQGVAWGLTLLMVFAAVGIGYAKAPTATNSAPYATPAPEPGYSETVPPASADSYVWDNADVLSAETVRELNKCNERLWQRHQVSIGVVTCNYGRDDLYNYAMKMAEEMGLGGYDMIVVLDIEGDNYWLLQGNDIRDDFTDDDCSDYAYEYLEYWFARGFYGDAVTSLTDALEVWYGNYFG